MKTPLQEMLEWVRATLPMDLDTPRLIEQKIESMLEKEKEVIMDAYNYGQQIPPFEYAEKYYDLTFNNKEK